MEIDEVLIIKPMLNSSFYIVLFSACKQQRQPRLIKMVGPFKEAKELFPSNAFIQSIDNDVGIGC